MNPWLADEAVTLYHGDARDVLAELPAGSVDCVVTSPPYWGLRDYGIDGQLGLEGTPDEYVTSMVAVFREVRRVLADHGTCWVNLGDSYAGGGGYSPGSPSNVARQEALAAGQRKDGPFVLTTEHQYLARQRSQEVPPGLKPKDLVGIPWRVALALQADGWWLRSDIIWAKPNPMPESVTDRPTKAHEYVFLLTKTPRYWFDQEAVREPHSPDGRSVTTVRSGGGSIQHRDGERWPGAGRNIRSVWHVATQSYPEAHFATFPEELARRCILAGCPTKVCATCGQPWVRIVELGKHEQHPSRWGDKSAQQFQRGAGDYDYSPTLGRIRSRETRGFEPSCGGHGETDVSSGRNATAPSAGTRPGVVLDPFVGSGTSALVAREHGRKAIGVDINEEYLELAARRAMRAQKLVLDKDLQPAPNGTLSLYTVLAADDDQ